MINFSLFAPNSSASYSMPDVLWLEFYEPNLFESVHVYDDKWNEVLPSDGLAWTLEKLIEFFHEDSENLNRHTIELHI